jgi:hypothetical protein
MLCRDDFGSNVKRIAKKIQGALPVIGLLSRLASPEGGFDEIVSRDSWAGGRQQQYQHPYQQG